MKPFIEFSSANVAIEYRNGYQFFSYFYIYVNMFKYYLVDSIKKG